MVPSEWAREEDALTPDPSPIPNGRGEPLIEDEGEDEDEDDFHRSLIRRAISLRVSALTTLGLVSDSPEAGADRTAGSLERSRAEAVSPSLRRDKELIVR